MNCRKTIFSLHHVCVLACLIGMFGGFGKLFGTEYIASIIDPDSTLVITGVELVGLKRTNPDWLKFYLGIPTLPASKKKYEIDEWAHKLLTTEVYKNVEIVLVPNQKAASVKLNDELTYTITITVEEKWTTIPVIRGAYGGGTPLTVLGIYDTHSFGKLWTLGAEGHHYGSEPWGGVVWMRAPRFGQGNRERGLEGWRQFRLRTLYNSSFEPIGSYRTSYNMVRVLFSDPNPFWKDTRFKNGFDIRFLHEEANEFSTSKTLTNMEEKIPQKIKSSSTAKNSLMPLIRAVFDDIRIDNLDHEGFRLWGALGPIMTSTEIHSKAEAELFYFYLMRPWKINFAGHLFVGNTSSPDLVHQYFLGGFDSIRGIPDGAVFGNKAAYANFELRHVSYKARYAWFQPVVFTDMGSAGNDWNFKPNELNVAYGLGLRLAIPQVYRLIFRLDYAWNAQDPRLAGVSLGMNQFFQPYKPL